jgi:hypothetical protein
LDMVICVRVFLLRRMIRWYGRYGTNADMPVSIYAAREDVSHGATPGDPHLPSDRPGKEWVDVSTWPGVRQAKTPDWYRIMPRSEYLGSFCGTFLRFISQSWALILARDHRR